MLLRLLLSAICLSTALSSEEHSSKPYIFPIPLEMPNRNDRADQCWVRIEDVELIETLTIYCYLAHEFLRSYIPEYNSRKMTEDDIDVSLWSEEPKTQIDLSSPKADAGGSRPLVDWKVTTVMDPTTKTRLYVSQKAVCRLVMYSREGMSNYRVECDKILYFVNEHVFGSAVTASAQTNLIAVASGFLIFLYF